MCFKKVLSLLLLSIMMVSACCCTGFADNQDEKMSFLRCHGSLIYNENNEAVTLRGTNLGGWLVWEEWMGGFTGAHDGWHLVEKLESRFGREKARQLIDTYRDNYITESDFDTMKSLGFNCIRLPFWYQNLESDAEDQYDFSRLDYAVEMCAERGIYIVLDCHGLPGFQSIAHHSGKTGDCRLYDDTEEGEYFRKESVRLWKAVADRYKNCPVIAAYDLMNEPMCDFNELQDDDDMWKVYDLLYDAVREIDTVHIVIMEGIWDFTHLPDPADFGWENVMYELHSYNPTNAAYRNIVAMAKIQSHGVPVFEGEFHPSSSEAEWTYILNLFNRNNISWTTWTYKGFCSWGESDWFMYGCNDTELVVNLDTDSFDTIMYKWGDALRTQNYHVMGPVETLKEYANQKYEASVFDRIIAGLQQYILDVKLTFHSVFQNK